MSDRPLKDIKEFNLWDNDGLVVSRAEVMPLKKHKFVKENVTKLKEVRGYDSDIIVDDDQEYWTQKHGFHWRTCKNCGTYVKGVCWRCGDEPSKPRRIKSRYSQVIDRNKDKVVVRKDYGGSFIGRDYSQVRDNEFYQPRKRYPNINALNQLKNLGRGMYESKSYQGFRQKHSYHTIMARRKIKSLKKKEEKARRLRIELENERKYNDARWEALKNTPKRPNESQRLIDNAIISKKTLRERLFKRKI